MTFSYLLHLSLLRVGQIEISEESARHPVAASHPVFGPFSVTPSRSARIFRLSNRKWDSYGERHNRRQGDCVCSV